MIRTITQQMIADLMTQAADSPRKRTIYRLHEHEEPVQRMINALVPGTYTPPHKHENPDKVELFSILVGKIAVLRFDDTGSVQEIALLDARGTVRIVDIPPRTYHALVVLEPSAALEIIQGPYDDATHKQFAPWAPAEDSPDAPAYLHKLEELVQHMALIRPAVDSDLPHLPEIEAQAATLFAVVGLADMFASDTLSLDQFRTYQQAGHLWVAIEEDHPVGFIAVSIIADHAHIDEVDVRPDYGRRGIGRALIESVCIWAAQQGRTAITLTTQRNVPWNAPFYEKLGFEIMNPDDWTAPYRALWQKETDAGLPVQDRVLMKLML